MSVVDIMALVVIVGAFLAFMGTLAWVSETEGRSKQQRPAQSPKPSPQPPIGARHA